MQRLSQNVVTGSLFIAIGGFFAIYSYAGLEIGTAFNMGPGYFPLILGTVLAGIGVLMALRAPLDTGEARPIPWRALVLVLVAPAVLGLTVRIAGLLPAVAAMVLISSFASPVMRLRTALVLAATISLFCYLVFHVALGLPVSLFGRLPSLL